MSDASDRTGEAGIGFLEFKVPQSFGYIFRSLPTSDYGIDGMIEIADDAGAATGRLIATQVKAGPSYFEEETASGFIFRGKPRHLDYWQYHSLPVIVVLVDLDAEVAYWAEVDNSVVTTGANWKIEVPKRQLLDGSAKAALRAIANKLADEVAKRAQQDYDAIRESYLEGRRRAARAELDALVQQPSWRFAPRTLQAEAFRSLALWSFVQTRDLSTTEAFLVQAKTADRSSDESVVRAMVAALTGDAKAALPILEAPATVGARNLRILFLVLDNRVDEAEADLLAWPTELQRTAETTRVEALVAYARGDLARARERIAIALAEKPNWQMIRETYALIEYASSLPPSERPEFAHPVPAPILPALLRHDDASLVHLRAAAAGFEALRPTAEDEEDRQRFELWRLAALANDPAARETAKALASEALARPKLSAPVVAWVLQRGLTDEPDTLTDRLLHEVTAMDVETARTEPGTVVLAIQTLVGRGRYEDARVTIDRFEVPLLDQNADALHCWRSLIASEAGDIPTATTAAAQISHVVMRAEAYRVLEGVGRDESNWRATANDGIAAYRRDGDAAALFDAIRLHANHDDPHFVLATAEELFALLPNLTVLEMICHAAWHTGQYRLCLDWLDRWRAASSVRTEALEQTRVACLIRIDPLEGAKAARALLLDYPSSENAIRAMSAFLRMGDLKALSIEARRLLNDPAVDSVALLNAAQMTAKDDHDLAVALLRKAMRTGVDDDHVGAAVSLAHQLGQDHATATLMPRMHQLAAEGRGGVEAKSLAELLAYATDHQERVAEILARFYAAEIPIHGVARVLGWTLAEVFHLWSSENRDDPKGVGPRPLLTRFGGLPAPQAARLRGRQLAMDISAFLLAADLGLLDAVERAYAPIRVSPFLPAALVEQQRRLGEVQPSRIEMFTRIVRLVDAGKVNVLDVPPSGSTARTGNRDLDTFLASASADMLYVEHLPITDHELHPIPLDLEVSRRVVSIGDILATARRNAVVDEDAYREAATGLPPAASDRMELPGRIVLSEVAATTLGISAALEQLAAAVEVSLFPSVVDEARASLTWAARRRDVSSWLDGLRERLRYGLENGVYVATSDAGIEVNDARDLDFETLRDLLLNGNDATRAVWIEDRACSRIATSVVGVCDILADLRSRGIISAQQHAMSGHMLRTTDVRYLPLDHDDVVHFVHEARARKVPNTAELEAISRYVARMALDGNRRNSAVDAPSEIAALLECSRVTASVVPEIWKLHCDDARRAVAHAGWFTTHVYVGKVAVRASTQLEAAVDVAKDDTAADLAWLYMGAVLVGLRELPGTWEHSHTAACVHWVSTTFALRKFFTDPDLVNVTGRHLAALARHFTEEIQEREELHGIDALLGPIFMLLPPELRHAWLAADPAFGERHGFRVEDGVQIGGCSVPAEAFWSGLEDALGVREHPSDAAVRISLEPAQIVVVYGDEEYRINDPLFMTFARGGSDACARWAVSHGDVFDMKKEKRAAEGRRVGALVSARDRVLAAEALRAGGGGTFYRDLSRQLRGGGAIPESDFRLSAVALSDYLRWTDNDGPSVTELTEDVGLEEALHRLMTLPMRLPVPVLAVLDAASDRIDIVGRMAAKAVAPLSLIHTATLALRFGETSDVLLKLGGELVDRLLSAEYQDDGYEAFERAFAAANAWLSFDSGAAGLTAEGRLMLAMSHACSLLDTIGAQQLPKAREFFTTIAALPREGLSRDPEFFDHVLYPTNIDYASFVVTGLASSLHEVPSAVRDMAGIPVKFQESLARLKQSRNLAGFFRCAALCQRVLPTLFDCDAREVIVGVAHETPFEIPTAVDLARTLEELLASADEQPESGEWWLPIQAIMQQHPVRGDNLERVRSIVGKFADEDTRQKISDRDLVIGLSCLAQPVAATGDEQLRGQFADAYFASGREFGTSRRDATLLVEAAPGFLEVALALSARPHDPATSARELVRHVEELIRVWPELAHALASHLSELVWTAPVDQSVPLWRLVLRAREKPSAALATIR